MVVPLFDEKKKSTSIQPRNLRISLTSQNNNIEIFFKY